MRISLSMYLSVIDGNEVVRIKDYNHQRTFFEGRKFMCPCIQSDVMAVYTRDGRIVIEVVE